MTDAARSFQPRIPDATEPPTVSRPRRILGVLAATAVLMSLTGVGILVVRPSAPATAVAAAPLSAPVSAPAAGPRSSTHPAEGSGQEKERSAADRKSDRTTGELD